MARTHHATWVHLMVFSGALCNSVLNAQPPPEWIHEESPGPGSHQADAMRINGSGQSFAVAHFGIDQSQHSLVYSVDIEGSLLWMDTIPNTTIHDLEITLLDEVIMTGWNDTGSCVTAKYNSDGTLVWLETFDGGMETNTGYDLSLSGTGEVYVTGKSYVNSNLFLVLKYTPQGTLMWASIYDPGGDYPGNGAKGIAVDAAGNCYVTGASRDTVNGSVFILSLGPDGNERWHRRTAPPLYSTGELIAVDGERVITTNHSSGLGTGDIITTAYDTSGTLLWEQLQTIPQKDFPFKMTIGPDGSTYVVGSKNIGNSFYHDIVVIALNTDGSTRWIRTHDGGYGFDYGTGLALDDLGRVVVAGFGPDTTMDEHGTIMVLCYDYDGDLNWSARYCPTDAHCFSNDIGVDGQGNAYVFGDCASSVPDQRLVILKYGGLLSTSQDVEAGGSIRCFPLPADQHLTIASDVDGSGPWSMTVYGLDGQAALHEQRVLPSHPVRISSLANGMYTLDLKQQGRASTRLKMVVHHLN